MDVGNGRKCRLPAGAPVIRVSVAYPLSAAGPGARGPDGARSASKTAAAQTRVSVAGTKRRGHRQKARGGGASVSAPTNRSISTCIRRTLMASGFVEEQKLADDKRAKLLRLTPRGVDELTAYLRERSPVHGPKASF